MLRLPWRFPPYRIRSGGGGVRCMKWVTQIFHFELLPSLFLWLSHMLMVPLCALLCLFASSWRTGHGLALTVCFLFWQHFDMPHDIAASEDGTVYVGDAHTNTVWKFTSTESMAFTAWLSTLFTQVYCLKTCEKKCACPSLFMVSSVGSQGMIQFTSVQFSPSVVSLCNPKVWLAVVKRPLW